MSVHGSIEKEEVEGTLLAEDRDKIFAETECSAAVRSRAQWGPRRFLTIHGPLGQLSKAIATSHIALTLFFEAVDPSSEKYGGGWPLPDKYFC